MRVELRAQRERPFGKEPRRRLRNPEMFQNSHAELRQVATTERARRHEPMGLSSRSELPRQHGPIFDLRNSGDRLQIVNAPRRTVRRNKVRRADEDRQGLSEAARHQPGVRKIARMDKQIEAIFDKHSGALAGTELDGDLRIGMNERCKLGHHVETCERRRNA